MPSILSSSIATMAAVSISMTNLARVLALGVALSFAASAPAADQNYDPLNAANVWDLTTPNWDLSTVPWTNNNHAIFGGTGETVTVNRSKYLHRHDLPGS